MADKFAWRSKSLPQINIDVFSRTNVCVLWFLLFFPFASKQAIALADFKHAKH